MGSLDPFSQAASSFTIDGHGVPKWYPPTVAKGLGSGVLPPKFYEGSSKDSIWNKSLMTKAMNKSESEYLGAIANQEHASQKILADREKVCPTASATDYSDYTVCVCTIRSDLIRRCSSRRTGAEPCLLTLMKRRPLCQSADCAGLTVVSLSEQVTPIPEVKSDRRGRGPPRYHLLSSTDNPESTVCHKSLSRWQA